MVHGRYIYTLVMGAINQLVAQTNFPRPRGTAAANVKHNPTEP